MAWIAYLDESGSLPDQSQPVIVIAALVVAEGDVDLLRPILPRIRKRLNQHRKRGKKITEEFKFELLCGHSEFQVIQVLGAIRRLPCKLVIVPVDKGDKEIADNPLNYAILISETVRLCHEHFPRCQFVFDRHYLASQFDKMQTVNHILAPLLGEPLDILHKDSQDRPYPGLGLVDFVAGTARFLATANAEHEGYALLQEGTCALEDIALRRKIVAWTGVKASSMETGLWQDNRNQVFWLHLPPNLCPSNVA